MTAQIVAWAVIYGALVVWFLVEVPHALYVLWRDRERSIRVPRAVVVPPCEMCGGTGLTLGMPPCPCRRGRWGWH